MLALLPALLLLAPALAHAQDYFINCGNARDGRFVANIAQTRTVVVASAPITGAQSQYLYQNHRTPISPVTSLTYTLPRRTPGIYLVELAFAEVAVATNTARCARGARLFHVDIQGTRVLTDFDVYATARGCRRALRRRFYNVRVAADGVFAVTITDGASGKAMISYINLKATGLISPTPPPPPSLASPSPQPSASPSPQPSASPKPSPSPKPTPSPSPTPVPERPLESCVGAGTIKRLAAGSAPKSRVDAVAAAALRKDAATGAGGSGRYTLALAARRGQRKGSRADAAAAAVKDTSGRISGLSRQAILARGSFFDTFDAVRGSEWWFAGPWANGGVFGNGFSPCYWTQAGGEISLPVQEEPFTNPSTAGSGVPGKVYDYTAGEIRSQGVDYGHGCYSWCAKPTSSSGVVSALYVYSSGIWDSPVEGTSVPWREIDIEFLVDRANGKIKMQSNIFNDPDFSKPGQKTFEELHAVPSNGFNVYSFKWVGDKIEWYINGRLVRTIDNDDDPVPQETDQTMRVMKNSYVVDQSLPDAINWAGPIASDFDGDALFVRWFNFTKGEKCTVDTSCSDNA